MFDFFKRKPKEEPEQQAPAPIQEYNTQQGRTPKQVFERNKSLLLKDPDYINSDEETQRKMVSDFFEKDGREYLSKVAEFTPEQFNGFKNRFIADTFDPEKKNPVVPEEEERPALPEDWSDMVRELPRVSRDATQKYDITDRSIEIDYPLLLAHKSERTQLVTSAVEKSSAEIKNPESFLSRGESAIKELKKELKGQGLSPLERDQAAAMIRNSVNQELVTKLREKADPGKLSAEVQGFATEFLKEKEEGEFLDTETGNRRNEPKTEEESDYVALREQITRGIANEIGLYDEESEVAIQLSGFDKEYEVINQSEQGLLQKKKELDDFYVSKKGAGTEDDQANYDRMYDEYAQMYDEYILSSNEFNKKVDEFNSNLGGMTEKTLSKENPTTKERLKVITEDAYLKMKHWANYVDRVRNQLAGNEPALSKEGLHQAIKNGQDNLAEAQAEFEAAARMYYNNQGPADVKRDAKFLTKHFAHNVLAGFDERLAVQAGASPMQMIQNMSMIADGLDVQLTEEEIQATKMSIGEGILAGLGHMGPSMAPLMLYGRFAHMLKIPTNGYKIIRSTGPASKIPTELTLLQGATAPAGYELTGATLGGKRFMDIEKIASKLVRDPAFKAATSQQIKVEAHARLLKDINRASKVYGKRLTLNYRSLAEAAEKGKSVKSMIPLDAKIPHGAELIKEVQMNPLQKAMAQLGNIFIDEAVYTQVFGFEPGAAVGLALAHKIPVRFKFNNRLQMLNPILGFPESGVSATMGVYGAQITAGIGEALFTDKGIADIMQQLFPDVSDTGKKLLTDVIVHTLFFGPTNALSKSAAKQQTAPYGIGTNRKGNPDYSAYFSPVKRDAVFKTARELEKKGMPDVAKELYKWLDLTREPITGIGVKMEREEALSRLYETAPIGFLRSEATKHKRVIEFLEREMRKPDPQKYVEFPIENYGQLKPGDVLTKTTKVGDKYVREYFEIIQPGEKSFRVRNVETGMETVMAKDAKGNFPFDPVKNYKLSHPLEIPGRLELHRSVLDVVEYQVAKRGRYGEQAKVGRAGSTLQLPPSSGEVFIPKGEISKREQRLEKLKEERAAMEQDKVVAPEDRISLPPIPKKKIVPAENILSVTGKEFSGKFKERQVEHEKRTEKLVSEKEKITEELKKYRGFISDLKERKEIQALQQRLNVINKDLDIAESEYVQEVAELGQSIAPAIEQQIKEAMPEITEESMADVMGVLWDMMVNPQEGEQGLSVNEMIGESLKVIFDKEVELPEVKKDEPAVPVETEKPAEGEKMYSPSLYEPQAIIKHVETGKVYEVLNPNKKGKSVLRDTETGDVIEVQAYNNDNYIPAEKPAEKPAEVREIVSAKDAARDLIKSYVLRGDTIEDIKQGQTGALSPEYAAQVGGYAGGKKYSSDFIIVSRIGGEELDPPQVVKLKEVYDSILAEKEAPAPEPKKEPAAPKEPPFKVLKDRKRQSIQDPVVKAVLQQDPVNFETAVLQFLLAGGKIKTQDVKDVSGWKWKDLSAIGMRFFSDNGVPLDLLPEHIPTFGMEEIGKDGFITAFIDLIQAHPTITSVKEYLQELYRLDNAGKMMPEPGYWEPKTKGVDKITELVNGNEELKGVLNSFLDEKGLIDFEKIAETLEKDPEFFTGSFPFELNDAEITELKNLLKDENRKADLNRIYGEAGPTPSLTEKADTGAVSKRDDGKPEKPPEKRQITTEDIKKELDDLNGLLDDIDFGLTGGAEASGGEADLDPRAKALAITKGVVTKMIDSGVYTLPRMVAMMLPRMPTPKLKQLIPFLVQSYLDINKNLPADIQSKMDINQAMELDEAMVDQIIAQLTKPTEDPAVDVGGKNYYIPALSNTYEIKRIAEIKDPASVSMMGGIWESLPDKFDKMLVAVIDYGGTERGIILDDLMKAIKEGKAQEIPKYDNPEYRKGLDEVIAIYKEMGLPAMGQILERHKYIDPSKHSGLSTGWEDFVKKQKDAALRKKYAVDLRAGRILPEPILNPKLISEEQYIEMIGDSAALVMADIGREKMMENLAVINEKIKILAQLGFNHGEIEDFPIADKILARAFNTFNFKEYGDRLQKLANGDGRISKESVERIKEYTLEGIEKWKESLQDLRRFALTMEVRYMLNKGHNFERFAEVEAIAEKYGVKGKVNIKEQVELALVGVADGIVRNMTLSNQEKFDRLLGITRLVPPLGSARTAESKELQQYSTPPPIAYAMTLFTNTPTVDRVLDPQAGQGILLIGAMPGKAWGNEIDPVRSKNLELQGIFTTREDSLRGIEKQDNRVPAINMNPPFIGELKETIDGYPLKGEYTIIAHNLNRHLEDTGKAAILAGAHVRWKPDGEQMSDKDLMFFNWLNHHYNVVDVINIPGEMYESMGTSYPTKLILVNGRKAAPDGNAPLYNESFIPVAGFKELFDRVNNLITKPNEKSILQAKLDANRTPSPTLGGSSTPQIPDRNRTSTDAPVSGEGGDVVSPGRETPPRSVITESPQYPAPAGGRTIGPNHESRINDGSTHRPPSEGGSRTIGAGFGTVYPTRNPKDLPVDKLGKPDQRTVGDGVLDDATGDGVTPYIPVSGLHSGNYVIPARLALEIDDALRQLRETVGDVDQFVAEKLNYPSVDVMRENNYFFAEQVDGIAMAIYQIENGSAMIIGHQTGTGKGRIAAGVMRYAIENGKVPVFITKSADLFTDIYRDLKGIGSAEYKPFIINTSFAGDSQKVRIFDQNTGKVMYEVDPGENKRIIGTANTRGTYKLPEDAKVVLTTYSQFTTDGRDDQRRNFLMELNKNHDVLFIMDESHMASGQSATGEYFMNWMNKTSGGLFLSATYAKRPDNMPIYSMKTVLRETNMEFDQLIEAIQRGSTALQEIITQQLAETGQFSKIGFKMDAEMNFLMLGDQDPAQKTYNPELARKMRDSYDNTIQVINDIISFQRLHIDPIVRIMNTGAKKEGGEIAGRQGTSMAGVKNHPYFSRVWNIVDQMLLAIKVREILPYIIEDMKAGRKPVIALRSTMESLFKEMEEMGLLTRNQKIRMDFSEILMRGVRTVLKYTKKDAMGNAEYLELKPEELPPAAKDAYYNLYNKIKKVETGITISPIDVLRKGITDAGFKVEEITGRGSMFNLSDDMTEGVFVTNDRSNKIQAVSNFNNNPGYAVIINAAGTTGISLHSGKDFKDLSQRTMYMPQPHLDINEVVQTLGRIYRADQVNKPIYNIVTSSIPAEQRMFMMLARKLKSLDANTSGDQKHSKGIIDVPDFLNKYGDKIVKEYLEENPDINEMLGDPLALEAVEPKTENAAHRVSGSVQILNTDLQETFYNEIVERYEREIEYLNAAGANDLMVTNEDLQAVIQKSEVTITGNGGVSAFGDDTVLNTAEVKVIRRPFTKKELETVLNDTLKGKNYQDYVQELRDQMAVSMEERYNHKAAKISADAETLRQGALARITKEGGEERDIQRKYQEALEIIDSHEEMRLRTLADNQEAYKNTFNRYLNFFYPGRVVNVPFTNDSQLDLIRMNKGVFVAFDINMTKPNPWVPSNFQLRFATADGRRMFRIPASKNAHIDSIIGNSYGVSNHEMQETLDNWDTLKHSKLTETRYIVTGNILQGMNTYRQGRLISFTMKDGSMGKGILMPENWIPPDTNIAQIPITKAYNIIRALQEKDFVESINGDVLIKNFGEGKYEIRVPESTKRGAKYYKNTDLTDMLIDRYWEKRGDRMVGYIPERNLKQTLEILYDNFKTSLEVDSKHVHHGENQTNAYNMMQEYSIPQQRQRTIDRKGLSDPTEEAIGVRSARVGDRIPPDPITGEKPKKIWEIQFDASAKIGQKLYYMRRPGGKGSKAAGAFVPTTWRTGIKWIEDLDVSAHELGHALDAVYGIVKGDASWHIWDDLKNELQELWVYGSKPKAGHPDPEQYLMQEGVAEFLRALLLNPAETKRRYPTTYNWVKKRIADVDPDVWSGMLDFGRDLRIWYGSTEGEKIMSKVQMFYDQKKNIGEGVNLNRTDKFGNFQFTIFDKMSRRLFNNWDPAETVWKWAMRQRGINPDDPRQISPLQNFEIQLRNHLGFNVKMRNEMYFGLANYDDQRIYSRKFGKPLSFELLFEQIPSYKYSDFQENLSLAVGHGLSRRIVEVVWKQQAKQVGRVLEAKDIKLPPMDILKEHPYRVEKHQAKINDIMKQISEGKLDPKDVFLPKEMFDFTGMVVTGTTDELITDYATAKKWNDNLKGMKTSDPEKYEWINNFLDVYYEFSDAWVNFLKDSGLITEASAEQIGAENLFYIAMRRFMDVHSPEDLVKGKKLDSFDVFKKDTLSTKPQVHAIMGSHLAIKDPIKAFWEAWVHAKGAASMNHVITSFAQAFTGQSFEVGKPKRTSDIAWVSENWEPGSVQFYVKGKPLFLVIRNDSVRETLEQLITSKEEGTLETVVKAMPRMTKFLITTSVSFFLRNPIRDFIAFLTVGRDKRFIRPADFNPNPKDISRRIDEFELSGAGMFGWVTTNKKNYNAFMKEMMLRTIKDPKKILFLPWAFTQTKAEKFLKFLRGSELVSRLPQFSASKRRAMKEYGLSEAEAVAYAGFTAADLMDFRVGGTWVRPFNDFLLLFLNPAFRGYHKMFTAAKDRPWSTFAGFMSFVAFPSMMLPILYSLFADDETIEEYLALPDYVRDMFWVIPTGNRFMLIPKPFEIGFIASAIQRKFDKELLGDKNAFSEQWFENYRGLINPVALDSWFGGYQGAIAAGLNKDLFRKKFIVPPAEEQLSIAARETDYASKFSKFVMEISDWKDEKDYGVDPRKLDAFIEGTFSWWGRMFLKGMEKLPLDKMVGQEWEPQDKRKIDWTDTGLSRRRGQAYDSPDVQWVLKSFKKHRNVWQNFAEYEHFNILLGAYFSSEVQNDTESRMYISREIIRAAKEIKENYENVNFNEIDYLLKKVRVAEREGDN